MFKSQILNKIQILPSSVGPLPPPFPVASLNNIQMLFEFPEEIKEETRKLRKKVLQLLLLQLLILIWLKVVDRN